MKARPFSVLLQRLHPWAGAPRPRPRVPLPPSLHLVGHRPRVVVRQAQQLGEAPVGHRLEHPARGPGAAARGTAPAGPGR